MLIMSAPYRGHLGAPRASRFASPLTSTASHWYHSSIQQVGKVHDTLGERAGYHPISTAVCSLTLWFMRDHKTFSKSARERTSISRAKRAAENPARTGFYGFSCAGVKPTRTHGRAPTRVGVKPLMATGVGSGVGQVCAARLTQLLQELAGLVRANCEAHIRLRS